MGLSSPAASLALCVRLRHWRRLRGLSQLSLATEAATTARHLSFLETGRSRPSREMVTRLSDVLSLPLRARNDLLEAAGLAPGYPEAPLDSEALAPFRAAIDRLLRAHEPYPAMVVDGHYNVIDANAAAVALVGSGVGGSNLIRSYADAGALELIVNWPEVARAALTKLHERLSQAPHDAELHELVALVEEMVAGLPPGGGPQYEQLIACPESRAGDRVIRTIGIAARFDSALDVTLDELRIELLYPADDAAERFFRGQRR